MAQLKVPSLQHLARNWRDDPTRVSKILVRLALNPPTFSYNPLFLAVRDLLVFGVPYEDVVEGIKKGVKREKVRDNLLSVLPLIRDHFADVSPDFFQFVDRRFYPVARELMVPFEPPMIYGVGGQLYFPWLSFWRRNPIARERLSLFVTLVDEVMLQDPDLETARFSVLDFSVSSSKKRELTVIDARDIPRVSESRKNEMLQVFAEGFFLAQQELKKATEDKPAEEEKPTSDPDQPSFFDEPPP